MMQIPHMDGLDHRTFLWHPQPSSFETSSYTNFSPSYRHHTYTVLDIDICSISTHRIENTYENINVSLLSVA